MEKKLKIADFSLIWQIYQFHLTVTIKYGQDTLNRHYLNTSQRYLNFIAFTGEVNWVIFGTHFAFCLRSSFLAKLMTLMNLIYHSRVIIDFLRHLGLLTLLLCGN